MSIWTGLQRRGDRVGTEKIESAIRENRQYGKKVAELLHAGHVVARFDGRMEYGPRALGNRSILYQPADKTVNDWLNHKLNRTEFMPFAPVTLLDAMDGNYQRIEANIYPARFMTITFDCSDEMEKKCPSVVHVDKTARPQLIDRESNPVYYDILMEFKKLSGLNSIINTSFNMHEEPIVCTPADAIRAFELGHLEYLSIGNFLVYSPDPEKAKQRQ
jgi:carbamoyltransferase